MSAGMGEKVHRLRLGDGNLRVARWRFDVSGPVRSPIIKQSAGDSAVDDEQPGSVHSGHHVDGHLDVQTSTRGPAR
jgi:hypothetical protein